MTTEVRVELEDVGGRTKMVMTMPEFPATPRVPPDGRWRSTSSPPTSSTQRPGAPMSVTLAVRALAVSCLETGPDVCPPL